MAGANGVLRLNNKFISGRIRSRFAERLGSTTKEISMNGFVWESLERDSRR